MILNLIYIKLDIIVVYFDLISFVETFCLGQKINVCSSGITALGLNAECSFNLCYCHIEKVNNSIFKLNCSSM